MKRKLLQFNLAFLLIIPLALYSDAYGQRSTKRRPRAKTQVREVMVRDGGAAVAALDGRGKLWAVVIGVSRYKNLAPKSQLEFAHRDAEDFAAFLRSPKGGGYPPSQLTLLTNQAATLSAIRSALGTTLPRSVAPDDMVIIFFAGHGTVESERDGYLLAYDSDPQNLYATALQISELNRIVSERLKARNVILIADACHSGQLGMTSRGTGESATMVNRYLDEVGRSGKGIFRILASRQDQLSYEGRNWGNGHGAFTWFLLEGMRGQADDDKDGFVRVGELLKFLSNAVPKETQSLQTPIAAGEVDLSLPMAVVSYARPDPPSRPTPRRGPARDYAQTVSFEVHGAPGLEVYMDNAFRGRVLPNGVLVIDQLNPGPHDLSILSAGIEPINRKLSLSKRKTIVRINGTREITTSTESSPVSMISSSPLIGQITQALSNKDTKGAFNLYQQLVITAPNDPQRGNIESVLSAIFESIGQNAINVFIQSSGMAARPGMFQQAADAFRLLKIVTHNADRSVDAKLKFCEGKAMFDNRQFPEAVELFKSAIQLDPRAAHAYSALGMVYRALAKNELAIESFNRAAELAPSWALPQLQMGFLYRDSGRLDRAREAFLNASRFDPNYQQAWEQLMFTQVLRGELGEAEQLGNQIISRFPNSGLAYLLLARIYKESNRRQEAAEAYKKGLALPADLTPEQRADFVDRLEKSKKGKKKKKHNEF
ncbi:MAG TPA: caspase family protein [Blastocatellia bacterium]|nr:caspase family protein [Blastocatellia bacterium]